MRAGRKTFRLVRRGKLFSSRLLKEYPRGYAPRGFLFDVLKKPDKILDEPRLKNYGNFFQDLESC